MVLLHKVRMTIDMVRCPCYKGLVLNFKDLECLLQWCFLELYLAFFYPNLLQLGLWTLMVLVCLSIWVHPMPKPRFDSIVVGSMFLIREWG